MYRKFWGTFILDIIFILCTALIIIQSIKPSDIYDILKKYIFKQIISQKEI